MAASRSASATSPATRRVSFARFTEPLEVPGLLALQTDSFDWLLGNERWLTRVAAAHKAGAKDIPEQSGLEEIFEEISPIEDFTGTMSLSFRDHRFEPPKYSVEECKDKDMTYSAPMFVTAEFINNSTGEIKSQTVFMGDFPLMSPKGTFIINGTERVVVSQLVRSPGRLLRPPGGQDLGQGHLQLQGDPVPRRLARVRDRQAGQRRRAHRPQAQAERHRAAQGARLGRGADPGAVRRLRVDAGHPGEGPHDRPGRRPARHLPQAAAGRAADQGVRPGAAGEPVLQPQAVRPGQGRPLQDQQEARPVPADPAGHADRGRHRRHHRVPGPAARGRGGHEGRRRHRSRSRPTTSTTSATGGCAPSAS